MTWEVKQHSDEIRSGDRVFLWESGKDAGVVALATILSNPTSMAMPVKEAPYVRDSERFGSAALRVQLRIDELLSDRLLRSELLNLPG